MLFRNTHNHFGLITILLHWIMAVLIIGMLCLGLYMTNLPISAEKLEFYGYHKECGVLVLMLVSIRFIWRLSNILPSLANLPWWERIAARSAHWAFYVFMFMMPVTGLLMTSAAGVPVSFFGLFVLPNLISPNTANRILFLQIHQWTAYLLITTICVHIAAALKHHFIDKDDILKRMISP